MGTKKGQRRKTARRAYEPRRPQKSKNGRKKRSRIEDLVRFDRFGNTILKATGLTVIRRRR